MIDTVDISEDNDSSIVFDTNEFEVEYTPELRLGMEFVKECNDFFLPEGTLLNGTMINGRSVEARPQQTAMAIAIAEALSNGENLCVEAPTGVGKSFAYLIPLIFRAKYCKLPALVSTETINLQQQLIKKDLPLLHKLTGIEFKAVLAKGMRNYICRRRLGMLCGEQRDILLPAPSLVLDVERIEKELDGGGSGERDEFNFRVGQETWDMVCCEGGNCGGGECEFFRTCFYYRARRQWEKADIIVANHALFFTDLALRNGESATLLPDYGVVVIDEAHTLENNAAEHLGLRISLPGVIKVLNKLYNPESMRGLLMRASSSAELRGLTALARDETYGFFAFYEKFLKDGDSTARTLPDKINFPNRLTPVLLDLCRGLEGVIDNEDDEKFRTELTARRDQCREYIDAIDKFINRILPEAVYYVENERGAISLQAAPLNVNVLLADKLFSDKFPVILCSATLTVGKKFDYFIQRTGFEGGKKLYLDSPFDPAQAQLLTTRNMPDPNTQEYIEALIIRIRQCVEITNGKAFVLFTSYQTLRICADALRDEFSRRGWKLLEQGGELSRFQLLKEFQEDINSVLFGTDSFWTGVDVPGDTLSMVIITKLPFAVPTHPLIRARLDRIRAEGKSDFTNYSLPEAVLKFRQGAGRLIRNRSDHGYIAVLDPRLLTKGYGRTFLSSLPYSPNVF